MPWNNRGSADSMGVDRVSVDFGSGSPRSTGRFGSKESVASAKVGSGLPVVESLGQNNRQLLRRNTDDDSVDFDDHSLGGSDPAALSSRFGSKASIPSGGRSAFGSKHSAKADLAQAKGMGLQLGAGWSVLRPDGSPGSGRTLEKLEKGPVALDRVLAVEFSNFAISQLNQMYAYMEQAMSRERARHSSDVHLLMRKVDKDLKDTFRAVREAFMSLTQQVQELLREVAEGKKSIANIQAKFDAAKTSAAIRAQYVEELEAVLDGQVPNISEAMRKLTEELTCAKMHVDKINKEAAEKESAMLQERSATRAIIRSLEERLNEKEVLGFAGATELPLLPEMSATWTRRQNHQAGSDGGGSLDANSMDGVDIVMARSDATRAVTRNKCVRPLGSRPSTTASSPRLQHLTRAQQQQLVTEVADVKKRIAEANVRVARQNALFLDAAPSLQLLRDIFAELRENWRLQADDQNAYKEVENKRQDGFTIQKAPEVLDHITHLFVEAFPQLGSFSEVLEALCEEAKMPCPQLATVADALYGSAAPSDGNYGSSAASCEVSRRPSQLSPVSPTADAVKEELPTPSLIAGVVERISERQSFSPKV